MSEQNLDYVAIGRNVEKGVEQQKRMYRMIFFWSHLVVFMMTMLVVWGITMTNPQLKSALFDNGIGPALVVILPTALWAMMILSHGAYLYIESAAGQKAMRNELLMAAVGEEILRKGMVDAGLLEKAKRYATNESWRGTRLDDGEYQSSDEDEDAGPQDRNARSNHMGRS